MLAMQLDLAGRAPCRRGVAASSMSWIRSRPWCADSRLSERDSVYFTGLPSRLAATNAITSSGVTCELAAEAAADVRARPPGSCARACRSSPRAGTAGCAGSGWPSRSCTASPVGSTTTLRGSMNAGISRCWTYRRLMTTSASARALRRRRRRCRPRPSRRSRCSDLFVPLSACTSVGALGQRRLHVEHDRQRLVVDLDRLERVERARPGRGRPRRRPPRRRGAPRRRPAAGGRGAPCPRSPARRTAARPASSARSAAAEGGDHAGPLQRGARRRRGDPGVRHRAAQDRQVQHARAA